MPRGDEHTGETRESAVLEVALPWVALVLVATVAMLVVGDVDDRARSMGWWFFAVSGAGLTGLAGTCTLLWLRRRGRNVPVAITLSFATLPWLTGLGGMRFGMHRVEQALEHADWMSQGVIALRGWAEASASAAYGQHLAAALLSATAVVLAARAERLDRTRVLVAVVVGSVAIAFVGSGLAIAHEAAATMMLVPLLAALVAYGAVAGRSCAPGVAIAAFLATLATCSATMLDAAFPRLAEIASSSSEHRRAFFEDIVLSHALLERSAWIAIAAIGMAALVLIGESMRRVDRTQIRGLSALAAVAAAVLSLHRVAGVSSERALEAWTRPLWQHVEGFVLAQTTDEHWPDEPRIIMSVDGAIWLDGEPVVPADSATLREALEEAQRRREALERERYALEEAETPEWLLESEDDPGIGQRSKAAIREPTKNRYGIGGLPDEDDAARARAREQARWVGRFWERPAGVIEGCAIGGRPVSAVVDARASLRSLLTLLEASGHLGVLGRSGEAGLAELSGVPLIANVAVRDSLRSVVALDTPRGACDALPGNDVLLTAVLGTEPVEMLRDYETGAEMPLPSALQARANDRPIIVFVRPEAGATVQDLTDFARALRVADQLDVVLVRELPELPPLTPLPAEISDDARDADVELSGAHPEALQGVLDAGRSSLDECARRLLTLNPGTSTYLRTSARIGTDGRVRIVRTLGDGTGLRPMRACIAEVVRTWSFPPSEQDTIFTFGMILGAPGL